MTDIQVGKRNRRLEPFVVFYRGNSMRGTFSAMERLRMKPVPFSSLSVGDVIVFQHQREDENRIVHRIISKAANGFVTRGDNMLRIDPYVVQDHQVLGKVVAVWRDEKWQSVRGGLPGVVYTIPRRMIVYLRVLFKLEGVRSWIRSWNTHAARSWPGLPLKVEQVTRRGRRGEEQYLRWRGRRIASRKLPHGDWRVRVPFGFLLSPDALSLPEKGDA